MGQIHGSANVGSWSNNAMSDGSSVYYNASFSFPKPIRLHGEDADTLKIIIQDDLSNLTELKVGAIGWEELMNKKWQ